jgi:hypothetical protein
MQQWLCKYSCTMHHMWSHHTKHTPHKQPIQHALQTEHHTHHRRYAHTTHTPCTQHTQCTQLMTCSVRHFFKLTGIHETQPLQNKKFNIEVRWTVMEYCMTMVSSTKKLAPWCSQENMFCVFRWQVQLVWKTNQFEWHIRMFQHSLEMANYCCLILCT